MKAVYLLLSFILVSTLAYSIEFTEHVITTSAAWARVVYAADVDGDGDMDVLSASYNDDTIAWYENDGSESFTKHVITTQADYYKLSWNATNQSSGIYFVRMQAGTYVSDQKIMLVK